jgi:glucosylglycerate synthase
MASYEENPRSISKADIVVAIPSFNEADMIGFAAEQAAIGLVEYFGNLESVLINCDNHSTDGTKEAFMNAPGKVPKIYLSTAEDARGKGNNLRNLFEKVRELEAQTVIVIEADIRNIAPYWIRNLGQPILKGAGYVCPLYVRHKYEATLTSSIVYPLIRCLYGRRVRQPDAGDFGFKGELVGHFLESPVWTPSVQHFGVDVWMTTIALNARVPIYQSFMGSPKIHRAKDPYAQLGTVFRQIVGTMFDLMNVHSNFWRLVKWSKPTALFGMDALEVATPVPLDINMNQLHERFLKGFDQFVGLWEKVFDQTQFHKLLEIRSLGLQHFSFPGQTWARILFEAFRAYSKMEGEQRMALLDSLLPLYLGKVLSFVKKTERMSLQQAEEYIENECMVFEENKPYLIKVCE